MGNRASHNLAHPETHTCGGFTGRAQVACSQCALGDMCLPRGLDDTQIGQFERIVNRLRPLQRGDHVFRAGEPFSAIVAVRTGCFKSYVINQEGEEHVLGFHLPGEVLGLDAIHRNAHTANVVALDTSAVCALGFDSVRELSRHLPELQSELFRIMSQQISELESNSGDLTAEQRIARFLLSLSGRFAQRGYSALEFNLAMSRRDIASHLRLATETVSRVFARLQDSKLLSVNRKHIRIHDIEALRGLANASPSAREK